MKTHRASRSKVWMRLGVGLLGGVAVAAAARDDIKVYHVPKTAAKPAAAQRANAGLPGIKYQTPEGWNAASPGPMRVASFNVKSADGKMADVSVIPLPGTAGGDGPNVNRWRTQQLGLPSLTDEEINQQSEEVAVAGQPARLHDLAGTNTSSGDATRILGVIQHREGMAWFYKMTGDDQLVAKEKPKFVAFLKSVEYVAGGGASPAAGPLAGTGDLPDGHPPIGGNNLPPGHPEVSTPAPAAAAPVARAGQPKWEVPAGWKEVSGGQFLAAKFIVAGEGAAQTAVNVSTSSGDGGGLAGNVNRWRGQLGLGAWTADEVAKASKTVKVNGGEATFVELSGQDARTGQAALILGAMVPQGGQTWFYKLMGEPKIVEAQRAAFNRFVETVKY